MQLSTAAQDLMAGQDLAAVQDLTAAQDLTVWSRSCGSRFCSRCLTEFKVLTTVQGSHSGSRFSQWVKISQQLVGHATAPVFVSDRGFSQRFSFRVCTTAEFLAAVDRGLRGLPTAV